MGSEHSWSSTLLGITQYVIDKALPSNSDYLLACCDVGSLCEVKVFSLVNGLLPIDISVV